MTTQPLEVVGSFGFMDPSLRSVKNGGLGGRGTVRRDAGGWTIAYRHTPGLLRIPLGALGFVAGIVAVALLATVLDNALGFDLMAYRKGPLLVGMVGLLAGIGGWYGVGAITRAIFGKAKRLTVTHMRVQAHTRAAKAVSLIWEADGVTKAATFKPADPTARGRLLGQEAGGPSTLART